MRSDWDIRKKARRPVVVLALGLAVAGLSALPANAGGAAATRAALASPEVPDAPQPHVVRPASTSPTRR